MESRHAFGAVRMRGCGLWCLELGRGERRSWRGEVFDVECCDLEGGRDGGREMPRLSRDLQPCGRDGSTAYRMHTQWSALTVMIYEVIDSEEHECTGFRFYANHMVKSCTLYM